MIITLSYGLLFFGLIFLIAAGIYISQFAFGIKHPDFFEAKGISNFLTYLLSLIMVYGYPILAIILFIGYLGIPIPATSILLAAGSLAATGEVNMLGLILFISITNICGDVFGYFIGRKFTFIAYSKKIQKIGITPQRLDAVDGFLANYGMWCIFITHILLTPIEVPINLVAGISKYPFRKFLTMVFFAEILWTSFYISLGFFLGSNWLLLVNYITDVPKILTTTILGIFAIWIALQIRKKMHHTPF